MGYPVSFFQIQGADGKQLVSFYKKAFGWKGNPSPDGGLLVAPEEGGIPGAVGPSQDGASHLAFFVTVPNVTKHLAKVQKAGAEIAMPETELPGNMGSIGGFIDPAGNWVGLWHAAAANPEPTVAVKKVSKKKASKKTAAKKASKKKASKKKASKKKASKKKAAAPEAAPTEEAAAIDVAVPEEAAAEAPKKKASKKKSSKKKSSKKKASRKKAS